MQNTATISYLITFRESDPQRSTILKFILEQLIALGDLPIVLVEQDSQAKLASVVEQLNSPLISYLFVENSAQFNKSWGLNIAARASNAEQLIFADADMLITTQALATIRDCLGASTDAINPYRHLIDLDQRETQQLLRGAPELQLQRSGEQLNRIELGQQLPFCGGVFAITRALFDACGGMDERFVAWGGDDDAMSSRLHYFADNPISLDQAAYHLWHPSASQSEGAELQYLRNTAFLSLYIEQSSEFFVRLAQADKLRIADLNKYQHVPAVTANRASSESTAAALISCLCVTRGRVSQLGRAVNCFIKQDYPNKQLCIVAEDDDLPTIAYLEQLSSPIINAHVLPSQPKLTLGELRNRSVALAEGDYVCQWDDDDWYHPQRLSAQMDALRTSDKAANILARWMLYERASQAVYCSNVRLWEGSLLCRKDILTKQLLYSSAERGEDSPLIAALYIQDQLSVLDSAHLYVYNISGSNTWDAKHFAEIISAAEALPSAQAQLVRQRLKADYLKTD